MSKEPEALKCYLIAQSSNSNQFDHALRPPLAVYLILIIEQKVHGCVGWQERARPLTRPIDLMLRGGKKKDKSSLHIQGIWLYLLRSFFQMHQDKLSLLWEGTQDTKRLVNVKSRKEI